MLADYGNNRDRCAAAFASSVTFRCRFPKITRSGAAGDADGRTDKKSHNFV
jgi:hypothetical protein